MKVEDASTESVEEDGLTELAGEGEEGCWLLGCLCVTGGLHFGVCVGVCYFFGDGFECTLVKEVHVV